MAVLTRKLRWRDLGIMLVCLTLAAFVRFLAVRALDHVPQVVPIFYGGLVLGAGYFLLFPSRRPASSERKEAFRKPARTMVFGFLLLAGLAFVATLIGPGGTIPAWMQVMLAAMVAGAVFFIWRGNRQMKKEAAAHPGKHAGPTRARSMPESAATDDPQRSLAATDQAARTGPKEVSGEPVRPPEQ